MRDRFGKALLDERGWDWQSWRDRLVLDPERLIDPAQQRLAEARRERRARAVEQVRNALEADLSQRRDGVVSRRSAERGSGAMTLRSLPEAG